MTGPLDRLVDLDREKANAVRRATFSEGDLAEFAQVVFAGFVNSAVLDIAVPDILEKDDGTLTLASCLKQTYF